MLPYEIYAEDVVKNLGEHRRTQIIVYYASDLRTVREESVLEIRTDELRAMLESAFLEGMTLARKIVYGEEP